MKLVVWEGQEAMGEELRFTVLLFPVHFCLAHAFLTCVRMLFLIFSLLVNAFWKGFFSPKLMGILMIL